jgi:hypothetical protein
MSGGNILAYAVMLALCASAHAAAPNVTLTQNSSSIPRYDIYELTMTNPATYANPWEDVTINATLTAPSGKTYVVGGFSYDGANIWKLRFAPMETGNWTWTLAYNDGSGVFNASGGFTCTASNNTGFLRIHPQNKLRFMTEGNAKPFYPLGFNSGLASTFNVGTTIVSPYTFANTADFLLNFKNAGNNMWRDNCQSANPIGWGGNFNVNGSGKNVFDATQCKLMDNDAAALHGVDWKFQLCFWTIPFLSNFDLSNPNTLQATLHLHQFMINRYGCYVDIWELMNEGFPTQAYMDTITTYVRAHDPYVHLITLSYPAPNQGDLDVCSPHFYMSSTDNTADSSLSTSVSVYAYANQPVVYGEAGEGGPSGPYSVDRYRTWIWTSFYRNAAPLFWLAEDPRDLANGSGIQNQHIGWEERCQSKIFTDFISGFDAAATAVTPTLAPAGQLRCYALASASDVSMYIVHADNPDSLLSGATVSLNIPAAMQGTFIDPKTGVLLQTVSVNAGQQTLAIPPFRKDVALRLKPGLFQQAVLQFSSSAYTADQTQPSVTLTVCRLGSSSAAVSVDYATSDGLAKAGTNYTATSGTLTWAANDSSPRTITVPLLAQTTMPGDLDFMVRLSNPTGSAVTGSASSATVTLHSFYSGAEFAADTFIATKGAPTALITVNRTGNGTGPWSVWYNTRASGTAVVGTDYVAIARGTVHLDWAAGDFAPKTFTVQLLNNPTPGTRYFSVVFNGGGDAVGVVRAYVAIVDNSTPETGLLSFSGFTKTTGFGGGEGGCIYNFKGGVSSTAQVHVSRTNGSSGAASVTYRSFDAAYGIAQGTAEPGYDYTAVSGTLSWADGDSADKIISVPILNNPTATGSPWFSLELSSPVGAILVEPPLAKVILNDPNPAPVIEVVAPSSGPSAGGSLVAISGMNFVSGASVRFGSNAATGVTVVSPSSIICTTPSGTGTVNVTVTNPGGASATLSNGYTYTNGGTPPLTLTSPATATPNPTQTGQVVSFAVGAVSNLGNPLTYTWTFGDGANGSGSSTTHVFTSVGVFTATATVADNAGNSLTSSVTVTVTNAPPPPPVITSLLTASGTVGSGFSYTITGSNSPTSFNASGLPAGLSVNTSTGVISGTPTATGTSNVTLSATNAGGTGSATLVLTINSATPPKPVINSSLTATGTVGSAFSYTITATNSPTSYNASGLPAGLSVNTSTGVISGTPSANGTSNVALSATNAGGTGSATLVLTINSSSGSSTVVLQDGLNGYSGTRDSYLYSFAATGNYGTKTPLYASVPSGLVPLVRFAIFQSEGGPVPNSASIQSATLSLYRTSNYMDTSTLNRVLRDWTELGATWNNANATTAWTTPGAGNAGTDIAGTADASFTTGSNSGWINFNVSNSVSSFASGAAGNYGWRLACNLNVNLQTFNSREYAADATLRPKLTITYQTGSVQAPAITSTLSVTGTASVAFSYQIAASNSPTSFNAVGLPNGLSVNTSTGLISGTPASAGTSNVTISASNSGGTGSATLSLTINNPAPPPAPVITSVTSASGTVGTALSYIIAASNNPTSFNALGLPAGLSVDTATGNITGTPTAAGNFSVTISASNSGGTGSATLALTITAVNQPVTVVLQDGLNGYSGTRDTNIAAYSPTSTFGANTSLAASLANGNLRPLVRFAIFASEGGPVPNGATIQSATLSLYRTTPYSDHSTLNRVLRDWKENEATWNKANAGTNWTTPGAADSGTDIAGTADAVVTSGYATGWVNFDVTGGVSAFASGSASNYGWKLTNDQTVNFAAFNSREFAADPTLRPKLTIAYLPSALPAAASAPQAMTVSQMSSSLNFAEAGKDTCSVQGSIPNLPSGFAPLNQTISIDISGVKATFVLDAKGKAKSTQGSIALKKNAKPKAQTSGTQFSAKLHSGTWSGIWSMDPVANASAVPMTLTATIQLAANTYQATVQVKYSAKAHVGGKFKK